MNDINAYNLSLGFGSDIADLDLIESSGFLDFSLRRLCSPEGLSAIKILLNFFIKYNSVCLVNYLKFILGDKLFKKFVYA